MSDIFDEADEILSAETSGEEEKSFNDSELQDIMSEIEDLEKEFETQATEMTLQEKIEAELAMEMENAVKTAPAAVVSEPVAIVETPVVAPVVSQVLTFEKPIASPVTSPVAATSTSSEVSFAAQGQMSLNLDFKVGQESAKLFIDPIKGLTVTLSGVELCINEVSGCTVSMENGTKFTIPLSSQVNSLKKKAA